MSVDELKAKLDSGEITLEDIEPALSVSAEWFDAIAENVQAVCARLETVYYQLVAQGLIEPVGGWDSVPSRPGGRCER